VNKKGGGEDEDGQYDTLGSQLGLTPFTFQLDLIVVSRASDKTGSFVYNYFVTFSTVFPGDAIKFSNYCVLKVKNLLH
jgi:hypothetical protein